MQSIPKTWLALLAILVAGAAVHLSLPVRGFRSTTAVLASFPSRIGSYVAQDGPLPDFEATRQMYAPAAIVYRDYADGKNTPVNLFVAPEPVAFDSPNICAPYSGATILQMSVATAPGIPELRFTQLVSHPPANSNNELSVCAYYWRTAHGPINEQQPLARMKDKLTLAVRAGESSFRVQVCTQAADASKVAGALEQLTGVIVLVDPEVNRLLHDAMATAQ